MSSRTYISTLERGLKDPTLGKIDALAGALEMHPLALVALSYVENLDAASVRSLLMTVCEDLEQAIANRDPDV